MPSSQNTTVLTIWSSTFKRQILQVKKENLLLKNSVLVFCVFPPVLHHKIDFPQFSQIENGNGLQTAAR